ncbi:MAG: 4-(cytidine 5'-diphospho)-2-C-methyl-D-erythritol kinase [Chloroflexi bacterium]|nr:4-(cytidine 5'-diphospho)-2-C-methyl-D-erythritol kinase [Chloroflexota bacterium]
MLVVKAYAKVNLTLEVLGKRSDGYHQVATVMQTVDLADELSFAPSERLLFRCNLSSLETADNLVLRAATLLKERTGCDRAAEIRLQKSIPVAAGLGGGSSDAAATLMALNRMWELALGPDELHGLAASLGSDVPFFLIGGTALAQGRGEEVQALPPMRGVHFVLLVPPVEIPQKTATLYGHLNPEHYTRGEVSQRLRECIEAGNWPDGSLTFNAFEPVALGLFSAIHDYRRAFLAAGAPWVRLTGTGPGMYTFVASRDEAEAMADRLRGTGCEPILVSSVNL